MLLITLHYMIGDGNSEEKKKIARVFKSISPNWLNEWASKCQMKLNVIRCSDAHWHIRSKSHIGVNGALS